MNPMREPMLEKITINVGLGEGGEKLERAITIVKNLTGRTPVRTITNKRLPDFGIRPGAVIGCKVTLRGKGADTFLRNALESIDYKLKDTQFDKFGNFAFGIKEHIDLPKTKYDPALGVIGMDVCATLKRRGYRVAKRRLKQTKIGKTHRLTKDDAISFAEKHYNVKITKDEEEHE